MRLVAILPALAIGSFGAGEALAQQPRCPIRIGVLKTDYRSTSLEDTLGTALGSAFPKWRGPLAIDLNDALNEWQMTAVTLGTEKSSRSPEFHMLLRVEKDLDEGSKLLSIKAFFWRAKKGYEQTDLGLVPVGAVRNLSSHPAIAKELNRLKNLCVARVR